jgi:hypothetical protein
VHNRYAPKVFYPQAVEPEDIDRPLARLEFLLVIRCFINGETHASFRVPIGLVLNQHRRFVYISKLFNGIYEGDYRWKICLNTDAIFSTQTAGAVQPKPSSASAIGRRLILLAPCYATDPIITESNSGKARAACITKFAFRFRHSSSGTYSRQGSELRAPSSLKQKRFIYATLSKRPLWKWTCVLADFAIASVILFFYLFTHL